MTRCAWFSLPLLALFIASACTKPAKQALPPIDACELVTLDEADPDGADLLSPVGNAVDQSVGGTIAKCSYGTVDLPVHVVSVEVRRFDDAGGAVSAQRSTVGMLRGLAGADPVPVAGLGDEAVWAGGRLNQLHVRAGDTRLIVTIEVGDEARRAARAQEIATRALQRLRAAAH